MPLPETLVFFLGEMKGRDLLITAGFKRAELLFNPLSFTFTSLPDIQVWGGLTKPCYLPAVTSSLK